MFKVFKKEVEVGGKKITLETGKIARQADGAIIAQCGEKVVMALEQLNDIEPLAWDFVLNFIKENDLQTDKISYSEIFSKDAIKR